MAILALCIWLHYALYVWPKTKAVQNSKGGGGGITVGAGGAERVASSDSSTVSSTTRTLLIGGITDGFQRLSVKLSSQRSSKRSQTHPTAINAEENNIEVNNVTSTGGSETLQQQQQQPSEVV